jgi:two-component system OmpR family sensor kinase
VLQTSVAIGLVVLLLGASMFLLASREQSGDLDRQLGQIAATADDVDDPPPGDALARLRPGHPDQVEITPGIAPALATVLAGAVHRPPGRFETSPADGRPVRILVTDRSDGVRWVVAADLRPLRRRNGQLAATLLLAELTGLAGALAVAVLLSRRSVAPLAQALAEQRRFVADASHELRAPLTVLHTRAQVLARRARTEPADRLTDQLDDLVADTRALGEVVEDLLISAELQHGRRSDTLVEVDRLAQAVVGSMRAYAESRAVTLDLHATEAATVVGAEPPLRRALTALIDNAIGHVAADGRVLIRVHRDGEQVLVSVIDNGVGVDPENVERLFDRFAHGDSGSGRRFGLGLALVQHVARAHGGSVRVAGAVGQGATFTLVLPAAPS